jgi:hypothetical protein
MSQTTDETAGYVKLCSALFGLLLIGVIILSVSVATFRMEVSELRANSRANSDRIQTIEKTMDWRLPETIDRLRKELREREKK